MTAVGYRGPGAQDPGARRTAELLAELFPEQRDAIRTDEHLLAAIADARRVSGAEPETIAYAVGLEDIPNGQPVLAVLAGRCEFVGRQLRGRGEAGTDAPALPMSDSPAPGRSVEPGDLDPDDIGEVASADAPAFPVLQGLHGDDPDDLAFTSDAAPGGRTGSASLADPTGGPGRPGPRVQAPDQPTVAAPVEPSAPGLPVAASAGPPRTQALPPVYSSSRAGTGAPTGWAAADYRVGPTSGGPPPTPPRPPSAATGVSTAGGDRPPRRNRRIAVLASVLALALVGGGGFLASRLWGSDEPASAGKVASASPTPSGSPAPSGSPTPSGSVPAGSGGPPFGTTAFFVRPDTIAAQWAERAVSDPRRKLVQERIANRAMARWFFTGDQADVMGEYVKMAREAGQTPVLVSFRLPNGAWCGGPDLPSAAAYRKWIEQIAVSVAGGPAVVVLEPYTLTNISCVPPSQTEGRLALLRSAVTRLSALPGVAVYLDGGYVSNNAAAMADLIKRAGGDQARGFAVNTAGTAPTKAAHQYADRVSASLQAAGAKGFHYIIDTSLSGGTQVPPPDQSCNAPGARIGEDPAPLVGAGAADAYVWVRVPGLSDGKCGGSEVAETEFDPVIAERAAG